MCRFFFHEWFVFNSLSFALYGRGKRNKINNKNIVKADRVLYFIWFCFHLNFGRFFYDVNGRLTAKRLILPCSPCAVFSSLHPLPLFLLQLPVFLSWWLHAKTFKYPYYLEIYIASAHFTINDNIVVLVLYSKHLSYLHFYFGYFRLRSIAKWKPRFFPRDYPTDGDRGYQMILYQPKIMILTRGS